MSLIEGLQLQTQQLVTDVAQLRQDVNELRAQIASLIETPSSNAETPRATQSGRSTTATVATSSTKTGAGKTQ